MKNGWLFLLISVLSCTSKKNNDTDVQKINWVEGESLDSSQVPASVLDWMHYYAQNDARFQPSNFLASGFYLSLHSIPDAIPTDSSKAMMKYHFFSPDSSKYIDLVSYNHFMRDDKLVDGEVDQQVILADRNRNSKKQLLYYGPSQLAETAAWIGNDRCMIAAVQRPEGENYLDAEILLINLDDSTYTHFQLDHRIVRSARLDAMTSYLDTYIQKRANQ